MNWFKPILMLSLFGLMFFTVSIILSVRVTSAAPAWMWVGIVISALSLVGTCMILDYLAQGQPPNDPFGLV
jgi:hypothetical protein